MRPRYLPTPDPRQPVQVWGERIATGLALFAVGFLVVVWALGEMAK